MDFLERQGISLDPDEAVHNLFKRCVQCPPTQPTCPKCTVQGEICSLVPQDCETCAHMTCIRDPNPPPPTVGPNVGAIAGGVVGGVALVPLAVYFIWRFWIRKRRAQQDQELEQEWAAEHHATQERAHKSIHDAASTRTRGSLANSILSRASNIIQIAYIPGVTNRNGSERNSIFAPVPPIPAAHRQAAQSSPLSNEGDALFFGIGDLRGSTYSGTSSVGSSNRDTRHSSNRDTRYTMASISPSLMRESVASDMQWDSATAAPMPLTTSARAAHIISVKSSQTSSNTRSPESKSSTATPPEPVSDKGKGLQVLMPGEGVSPSTSIRMKPTQISLSGKGKSRFPVRQTSGASTPGSTGHAPTISSPLVEREEQDVHDEQDASSRSLIRNIDFETPPAIQPVESPFFDASEHPSAAARAAASSSRPNPYASMGSTIGLETSPRRGRNKSISGLSAVIEEAIRRVSTEKPLSHAEPDQKKDQNPFSDDHTTDEQ